MEKRKKAKEKEQVKNESIIQDFIPVHESVCSVKGEEERKIEERKDVEERKKTKEKR